MTQSWVKEIECKKDKYSDLSHSQDDSVGSGKSMDTTTGWSTASNKTFHAAKNNKQIKTKKESKRNPRLKNKSEKKMDPNAKAARTTNKNTKTQS